MDCFSACFQNALRHFGIAISPELKQRLEVFGNGMQSCSIFESEERIAEAYGRSIDKLLSEWRWEKEQYLSNSWANQLLKCGIEIELRNGPIEQKKLFLDSLLKGKVCICEINENGKNVATSLCRHDILVVRYDNGLLEAHDPKVRDTTKIQNNRMITYRNNPNGTNVEINSEYFFCPDSNIMKPDTNNYQEDCGYRFIIVSKEVKKL